MHRPLADEIRPKTIDEVVGQRHILGKGAVLRRLIESGADANMVFYGPSGTGKTTVANIIAAQTNKTLYRLNATTASLQDIKDIIATCNKLGHDVIFLGDGVPVYKKQIEELMTVPYSFAPANMNRQRAASLGALACLYAKEGKTVSAAAHEPEYLRKSQAEREREEGKC